MANVFTKLQECRVALQSAKIKRSGKNKHAGYDYYELSDFLPTVNKLFMEHKLFSQVSFTSEVATLTIINSEKPDEQIVFTSPMEKAELRGVQPIQNVGAVQTYQRRYLYLMALEITEGDALDAMHDPNERNGSQARGNGNGSARKASAPEPQASPATETAPPQGAGQNSGWQMTIPQRRRLFALAKAAGVDNDGVKALLIQVSDQDSTSKLTREQYDTICEMLESQAAAQQETA